MEVENDELNELTEIIKKENVNLLSKLTQLGHLEEENIVKIDEHEDVIADLVEI